MRLIRHSASHQPERFVPRGKRGHGLMTKEAIREDYEAHPEAAERSKRFKSMKEKKSEDEDDG